MESGRARLAILASGRGSILQAIIESGIIVDVVVADRACNAIRIAMENDIPAEIVLRVDFSETFKRKEYSEILLAVLKKYNVSLVALAGFGTILTGDILKYFEGRMLNTHPSLLPSFKGWTAVRDALDAGVSQTGCTVHYVTEELDSGRIIAQEKVEILPEDSEESLHERIKQVERVLYPKTIRLELEKINSKLARKN